MCLVQTVETCTKLSKSTLGIAVYIYSSHSLLACLAMFAYCRIETDVVSSDDNFDFGDSSIVDGVPNPMVFDGSVWPVSSCVEFPLLCNT